MRWATSQPLLTGAQRNLQEGWPGSCPAASPALSHFPQRSTTSEAHLWVRDDSQSLGLGPVTLGRSPMGLSGRVQCDVTLATRQKCGAAGWGLTSSAREQSQH